MSLLQIRSLSTGYAGTPVVWDVDVSVERGEVVAVLGRNGVGKSTLVAAVSGVLPVINGSVLIGGVDVTRKPPSYRHAHGLRVVRQDRPVFAELTVEENLRVAGLDPSAVPADPFEFLRGRSGQAAGTLSGGEQKMLAITRVLADPGRIALFDEPTEGLQPSNVDRFASAVRHLADQDLAVLLVEQHLDMALSIADRWYVMEKGRVVDQGEAEPDAHEQVAARLAP